MLKNSNDLPIEDKTSPPNKNTKQPLQTIRYCNVNDKTTLIYLRATNQPPIVMHVNGSNLNSSYGNACCVNINN